ncbi:ABC transporter ATP-binding protein [Tissierella carlieri]|uniref:ABC transporter ATP-binding protein n=1 Tax=Tissierella carlieri TaxID=689904 RepID=UPI003865BF4D
MKDFIFKKKYKTVDKILDDTKINSVQVTKISTMRAIINLAEDLFIIAYFAYNVLAKIIWYDDFIVGINSYKQLKNSITQLLSVYTEIYKNDLYIKDYLNFMNNNINIVKSGDIALGVDDIECIEFKSVSFTYMNSKNSALRNINLTIKKNQKIAIVGENGAGKTTIIKLLLRLYDPDEGNIYINNIDIRDYSINSLRNAITVLFQDYSIYAFSIRDNIALNKNLSDYDINEYLEKVGLLDKINNLPFKLDTPITSQLMENGVEFSGGERQRLAIARSYARKSNILILDEPTSNLDPYIESKLYDDLLKDENEATMIIISHRMTFTYKMSRIICMSKGEIIAEGTHEDLINKNEYYRKLYNLNFSKYSS